MVSGLGAGLWGLKDWGLGLGLGDGQWLFSPQSPVASPGVV